MFLYSPETRGVRGFDVRPLSGNLFGSRVQNPTFAPCQGETAPAVVISAKVQRYTSTDKTSFFSVGGGGDDDRPPNN